MRCGRGRPREGSKEVWSAVQLPNVFYSSRQSRRCLSGPSTRRLAWIAWTLVPPVPAADARHRLPVPLRVARCSCHGRPLFRLLRSPLPASAALPSLSTVSVLPLVEPRSPGWRPSRSSLPPLRPWATPERPRRRRAGPRLASAPLPPPLAPGRSSLPLPCRPQPMRGVPSPPRPP